MEETYAAYLLTSARGSQTLRVVEGLIAELKGKAQIVVIPRYEDQAPMLKERFGGEVTLAEKTIDGPSLLAFTSVFIGAGGTMTAEAALLGVPSFSCYPGEPTIVEHFLVRERLVQRQTHPEVMVKRIAHVLGDLDRYRKIGKARATRLISRMEDPVEKIKKTVAEYLPSPTKR
jgi:predicted glycosyltransferase